MTFYSDHILELYKRLEERYESGPVPWDDDLPPPEVQELVPTLKAGKALDLGCGYGRASIYMAQLGWQVDAVDFIPMAVAEAAKRSRIAGVPVRFHIASVLDLDFLAGGYKFALDVGCGHNLTVEELKNYRDQLARLLNPGATFLIFARLKDDHVNEGTEGPSGVNSAELLSIFSTRFDLEWQSVGQTQVPDQQSWPSAWFRFRAKESAGSGG